MEFVRQYFSAEKAESIVFSLMGIIAIGLASYFWLSVKRPLTNGMAYPLLLIGLIQITVGSTVYMRSPKDIARVEQYIQNEPTKLQTEELPRMDKVMKNFAVYRYTYFAFMIVGVVLMFYIGGNPFIKGIGCGMFIQAALMLFADYFAELRGHGYIDEVRKLL
jgi:hypothetical protein